MNRRKAKAKPAEAPPSRRVATERAMAEMAAKHAAARRELDLEFQDAEHHVADIEAAVRDLLVDLAEEEPGIIQQVVLIHRAAWHLRGFVEPQKGGAS